MNEEIYFQNNFIYMDEVTEGFINIQMKENRRNRRIQTVQEAALLTGD